MRFLVMSKLGKVLLVGLVLTLSTSPVLAGPESRIKARLGKLLPEYHIDSIAKTPISGLYEVVIGPQVIYVSSDGRYMMQGELIDLARGKDLTKPSLAAARKKAVDKLGDDKMVIFAPDKYNHTVTVFTDIDCAYCRKLHSEIAEYEAEGIRVRYIFFPRAGVGSDSYEKAVAVWCSDDRRQALTDAKAGKQLTQKSCSNPVKQQMELGEHLGVSATPTILLENGELLPGYIPPKQLARILDAG
jgi:thiol:disulfide interchange protein DsbC